MRGGMEESQADRVSYPSFEEWKALAAQCDKTAHLVAGERKARASFKLVDPVRLSEAVAGYIDYEGLAYWVRPALERGSELPPEVCSNWSDLYRDIYRLHLSRGPGSKSARHETGSI